MVMLGCVPCIQYRTMHLSRFLRIQVPWLLRGRSRRATCGQPTSDTAADRPQPRKAEPRGICTPAKGLASPLFFLISYLMMLMSVSMCCQVYLG